MNMRASLKELPITLDQAEATIQEGNGTDWGGKHVGVEAYHQEFDLGPLMQGLPHHMCSSRHWGIVLNGEMRVTYADDSSEVVKANDVYYLPAGHRVVMRPGTRIVEWSEADEYAKVMEVVIRNLEESQK
jgi:mannose-6-phosphate isomerase-like protein (cupin superfamily)